MTRVMRTLVLSLAMASACSSSGGSPAGEDGMDGRDCRQEGDAFCHDGAFVSCRLRDGLLAPNRTVCAGETPVCTQDGCLACVPEALGCFEGNASRCLPDGSAWEVTATCALEAGEGCVAGTCRNLCEVARENRSYQGCTFHPVDLDATWPEDVEAPSFGIIVSNPNPFPIDARLEQNEGTYGDAIAIREIADVQIPPFDLETFTLDRRRIDGTEGPDGFVETHSAVTSRAYRVVTSHPSVAYQFNPLDRADAVSNDASLLFPVAAWGARTTVIGWPQTVSARGRPGERSADSLRATMTLVGAGERTEVRVVLGPHVQRVVGLGSEGVHGPGDMVTVELGAFDVLNLETDAYLADFSGTRVDADAPVGVFTGAEAADVPTVEATDLRQCCADHVEGQLPPDRALGTRFALARPTPRTAAINRAVVDPTSSLPVVNEVTHARVVAVASGTTTVWTQLTPPQDRVELAEGEVVTLRLDRDTLLESDRPISVIQMLPGQEAAAVPPSYPGGDPAMIVVPPIDQYRTDYVVLTPATYAFDELTLIAEEGTGIMLDDAPLPSSCSESPLGTDASGTAYVVHRCPLSSPELGHTFEVEGGVQGDGVHRLRGRRPFGVIVTGFDRYVSYAYAGGMNLELLR